MALPRPKQSIILEVDPKGVKAKLASCLFSIALVILLCLHQFRHLFAWYFQIFSDAATLKRSLTQTRLFLLSGLDVEKVTQGPKFSTRRHELNY